MSDGNIFNLLLTLPLFQGMSRADLQEAVAHTRLGFERYESSEVMVRVGDRCTHQLILVAGQTEVSAESQEGDYCLREVLSGPLLLQPERLFGLSQHYTRTFSALTPCQVMSIGKTELVRLCSKFDIFRINLFNVLTTQAQRAADYLWHPPVEDIGSKIIRFVSQRSLLPTGVKELHITMQTLASHIGESRLNVSRQLHQMEAEGIVHLRRNVIRLDIRGER